MKKIIALLLAVLCVAGLFAGCAPKDDKLVVATDPNFPPFEFMEGTEIVGVDAEIAKAIADELGLTLEMQNTDFDGIITGLASGKSDIALSGITINDERKETVDFSNPYITSVQYLLLPAGSKIKVMEDLAGKKVGAALGYTGQFVMEDEMDAENEDAVLVDKNVDLVIVNSAMDGSLDIQNKKLDALVMDEYVAKAIVEEYEGLIAIPLVRKDGSEVSEEYGVAVPKGNDELLAKINVVIDRLVAEKAIEAWVVEFTLR